MKDATFELAIKNPCADPSIVSITKTPLPTGLTYTLFSAPHADGFNFAHDPFQITSDSLDVSLCGPLRYFAKFDGSDIDNFSNPMQYDSATRMFNIFSIVEDLIGSWEITLSASLEDYPSIASSEPDVSTTIEIIDQCASLNYIEASEQVNPDVYYYTGSNPALTFTTNPYTISPPECGPVMYTCDVISGSRTDLCSVDDGST